MAASPTTIVTSRWWYPPRIKHGKTVDDTTFTTQVAPTILRALDLDPRALQAVREEGVEPLKWGDDTAASR